MRAGPCALTLLVVVSAQGQYVGSKACASCHSKEYQSFIKTPMGRSLTFASLATAPEFGKPADLLHSQTGRRYRMSQNQGKLSIEESYASPDKQSAYSDARSIRYTIGSGNHARSFLVERSGRLFQAPVTFFTRVGRWEMSPGYDTGDHIGFTRRVTANCLFCHSGRVNSLNESGDVFATPRVFAEAAIGCERCHGPGQFHLARRGEGIVNPAKLTPELRDQVCEQCHLFGAARVLQPGKSLTDWRPGEKLSQVLTVYGWKTAPTHTPSVTSHPQEMKQSVCWQKSRARLWCGSCHAVHAAGPTAGAAFYRSKCLTCHARDSCRRPSESSSAAHRQNDCIACHMPRRPVIESAHVALTDHRILRMPKPDEPRSGDDRLAPLLSADQDDPIVESRSLGFAYAEVAGATGRQEYHRRVVEMLKPLVGTNVTDALFWQTLGEAQLALREVTGAEESFRKAVELSPHSAAAQYSLGYIFQLRDRLPEAVHAYQQAVNADPFKAEAFGNLAAAYFKMSERDKAQAALNKALTLEPGNLRWRDAKQGRTR